MSESHYNMICAYLFIIMALVIYNTDLLEKDRISKIINFIAKCILVLGAYIYLKRAYQ